jgi:hypothetical protein
MLAASNSANLNIIKLDLHERVTYTVIVKKTFIQHQTLIFYTKGNLLFMFNI